MRPIFIITLLSLTISATAQGQKKQGLHIKFIQAWVWEYWDTTGKSQEMVVYYEPVRNYWLFNFEAYGTSGEMIHWVLGKPDGSYIFNASDEFGTMKLDTQRLDIQVVNRLPKYYRPTGKIQRFGDSTYEFPLITGRQYLLEYEKTTEQSWIYLSAVKANLLPVYYFNRLKSDAKLPIRFDQQLPAGTLFLSEELESASGSKTIFRFKYISHTEYYI